MRSQYHEHVALFATHDFMHRASRRKPSRSFALSLSNPPTPHVVPLHARPRWFAAGASLAPSLAAATTASTPDESVVAPSTYTPLALVAAKSREARRIVSFMVCLCGARAEC
eukprot:scaffold49881_cov58-Phaeocystis_antarctica.AAC.2